MGNSNGILLNFFLSLGIALATGVVIGYLLFVQLPEFSQ